MQATSAYYLGRLYEKNIPLKHRHLLGQYYTHPSLVDFVNSFCIENEKVYVLDPSCGPGIFLTRAYHRLRYLNPQRTYSQIISQLWGVDIEDFPVELALFNLEKLEEKKNKEETDSLGIFCRSFFDMQPNDKYPIYTPNGTLNEKKIPKFEVIVGNPPYTRQEDLIEDHAGSKDKISAIIENECNVKLPRRASSYAYFLLHSLHFLKNGGRLGFVIPTSWLNSHYGILLQQEFLLRTKIIALIESQVETWFQDSSVNTMVIILEKNSDIEKNLVNSVKFVQLKEVLLNLEPNGDFYKIDNLIQCIKNTDELLENSELRIFNISQKKLWKEGFSNRKKKYVGSSWVKYLRGPKIYFKIYQKAQKKLISLGRITDVYFSIKSGANKFFMLDKEKITTEGIEEEFWKHKTVKGEIESNKIISSLKDTETVQLNPNNLKKFVILTKKTKKEIKGTKFLEYVLKGEEKGFHSRKTCAAHRPDWYCLNSNRPARLLYAQRMGDRFLIPLIDDNVYVNKNLHSIKPHNDIDVQVLGAVLNSSITHLFHELNGRLLIGAQNVIDSDIRVVNSLQILDPRHISKNVLLREKLVKAFNRYTVEKIEHIFKELGTEKPKKFDLTNVKPHKFALDKILFEYISLNEDEIKQVYTAIIERVYSRKKKSERKGKKGK
ncbi:MAG: class I SAM-dependent DNA methyltransferase [Promethearchaeota archaeon]